MDDDCPLRRLGLRLILLLPQHGQDCWSSGIMIYLLQKLHCATPLTILQLVDSIFKHMPWHTCFFFLLLRVLYLRSIVSAVFAVTGPLNSNPQLPQLYTLPSSAWIAAPQFSHVKIPSISMIVNKKRNNALRYMIQGQRFLFVLLIVVSTRMCCDLFWS